MIDNGLEEEEVYIMEAFIDTHRPDVKRENKGYVLLSDSTIIMSVHGCLSCRISCIYIWNPN